MNTTFSLHNLLRFIVVLVTLALVNASALAQPNLQFVDIQIENQNTLGFGSSSTSIIPDVVEGNAATFTSSNPSDVNYLNTFSFSDPGGFVVGGTLEAFGTGNANAQFQNTVLVRPGTTDEGGGRGQTGGSSKLINFGGSAESITTTTARYSNVGGSGNVNATFTLAPTILQQVSGSTRSVGTSFEIFAGADENNLTRIANGSHTSFGSFANGFSSGEFFDETTLVRNFRVAEPIAENENGIADFVAGEDIVFTSRLRAFSGVDLQLSLGNSDGNEDLVIKYVERVWAETNGLGAGLDPFFPFSTSTPSNPDLPLQFDDYQVLFSQGPSEEAISEAISTSGLSLGNGLEFGIGGDFSHFGTYAQTGDPFVLDQSQSLGPGPSFITFGGDGSNSVPEPNSATLVLLGVLAIASRRKQRYQ